MTVINIQTQSPKMMCCMCMCQEHPGMGLMLSC